VILTLFYIFAPKSTDMNSFYLYFNVFTLINLSVLFIILYFRKNNSVTNKLLALIVIDPGLNFINNILIESGLIFKAPAALFLFQGTAQFYAPLVLAYVTLMMGQKYKWFSVLNVCTLIVVLLDIYFGIEFFMMSPNQQFQYLKNLTTENYPIQMNIINGLFVIVMTSYFIVAIVKIFRYSKVVNDFYSDVEKIKIKYIQHFIILLTALNFSLTIAYTVFATPSVEYFGIPLFINIIYVYIVYYAFRHSAILTHIEYCNLMNNTATLENFKEFQEPLCKEIKEIKKSQKEGISKYKLTEIEIEQNYQKILQYLEEQKPYLDPTLNLTKLSNILDACSHNISLTINTKFDKNFFSLINYYRVEEAKSLLKKMDSNNFTIEAIGLESGFNSKTAFYRAFKKDTNMTPSEYLQTLNN
jgi:AraC-like DNA-binding protein